MKKSRSFFAAGAVALVAGTGIAASVAAAAPTSTGQPPRHGELLRSGLVGRPADPSLSVAIRGVAPGGVPWALSDGSARLDADGRMHVEVDGLLITGTGSALDGTTGPVKTVTASLTCDGNSPAILTTAAVPLSPAGDARIDDQVTLPPVCEAPIVLVRANGATGPWIAAAGL